MTDDRAMWGDEPLDESLRDAAARYNEPGAVPREAMWARIEAARSVRVIPLAPRGSRRTVRSWHRVAMGAAALAAALLVGVAIGRSSDGGAPTPAMGGATVAGPGADSGPDAPQGASLEAGNSGLAAAPAQDAQRAPRTDEPAVVAAARADTGTGSGPSVSAPPAGALDAGRDDDAMRSDPSVPYRLAAVQHMSRAEALLTTFRAGARSGEVDAAIQPWARDLLTGTRLLIDSPASQDPALRALLGDLELVLAQIVQLSAQRRAEEVQIIDRQLDADGVITRLRSAVPSGTLARGA